MTATITKCDPGERATTTPGDIILVHRKAFYSWIIGIGQRLRFRGQNRQYAHWTHVACVAGNNGELIEALGKGVEATHISEYDNVEYRYVHVDATDADRAEMVTFLKACVGRPYGYGEIISLGLTLLVGAKWTFGNPGTLICSALGAQMLCRGTYIFEADPNAMMPANIAKELRVPAIALKQPHSAG